MSQRIQEEDHTVLHVFGQRSPNWWPDPQANRLFLRLMQNNLNTRLQVRGHLFLNEVYDELALPRTRHGALTGWIGKLAYVSIDVLDDTDDGELIIEINVSDIIWDKI